MDVCHLPAGSIFVTFADRHLWWTTLADDVIPLDPEIYGGATRARLTHGGWSNLDLKGNPLSMDVLPTRITKTASYRMPVCRFQEDELSMLINRLNGSEDPEVIQFRKARAQLKNDLADILRRLDWRDLEQLIDLIFAQSGWRRITAVGDQERDIDLIVEEPIFGDKAWVQVKAQSNPGILRDYLARFEADGTCQRFIFACAVMKGASDGVDLGPSHEVWAGPELATKVMDAGLIDWVFQRI